MRMRPRQDPERMKTLLARRIRRSWSWAELSRRSGVPLWTLRWWQKRFARTDPSQDRTATFVPVHIVAPPPPTDAPFELITPSGFRIRIPAGFAADELSRLVKVLDPQC